MRADSAVGMAQPGIRRAGRVVEIRSCSRMKLKTSMYYFFAVGFHEKENDCVTRTSVPKQFSTANAAVEVAKILSLSHAGAAAWKCKAGEGNSGPAELLFSAGKVGPFLFARR